MKPTQKQHANGCRFFDGVDHARCKAGVAYDDFPSKLPCRPHHIDQQYTGACPLFEFETVEAIEAHEKAQNEAIKKWINTLAEGLCPECGENVEPRRQVGRCVYGACGHRLFQGKL